MTDRPGRSRDVWISRIAAALFTLALGLALALAVVWAIRGFAVFNYTEGVVLGSLAGFDSSGLAGLYPPDWSSPPLVLTLYPPVFFWASAALDSILGASDPLVAPRLVSLVATAGLGWCLLRIRSLHGAELTWFLVLVGAAAMTPGVQRQLAAAQVDLLAAAWTVAGALLVLRAEKLDTPIWPAFACFAVAAFTKQSFVAAPAALLLLRATTGRRREALREAVGFVSFVAAGFLLLHVWTAGGFSRHTLAAVADSGSVRNFVAVMADSAPHVWVPIALLVLLGVRGRLRLGFPELWIALATPIHFAAMWKTGASVNYLLEPVLALLVLGLVRSAEAPWSTGRLRTTRRPALVVLIVLIVGSAITGIGAAEAIAEASRAPRIRMADIDRGFPLVEVEFFPAVLEREGRPYVSDPFAFGALAESGTWDPSTLSADLHARRVPVALTSIDIEPPLADGATTEGMLFAYFWRMEAVCDGLRGQYTEMTHGPLHMWVPREGGD
ncbi:MAG: hypothetical protein ACE5FP_05565 [Gemmatimonadota bacterium]